MDTTVLNITGACYNISTSFLLLPGDAKRIINLKDKDSSKLLLISVVALVRVQLLWTLL